MGLLTNLRDSISRATDRLFAGPDPKRIGIYGPPNAGKCLAPDERVLLADGTHEPIQAVFDRVAAHPDVTDVADTPGEEWLTCPPDVAITLPALGADLEFRTRRVSHVFRQDYDGPLYRVQTRQGRTTTTSPTHPFITQTPHGIQPIPAAAIAPGTKIAGYPTTPPDPIDPAQPGEVTRPLAVDGGTPGAGGLVWDEVTSVTETQYTGSIYDLTVPVDHTYVTSTGVVVHNTTLANRIARDWSDDELGTESHIPHETRRARRKENVEIARDGKTVTIDIVDTPGVTTKVDYRDFLEYDLEKDDAVQRSREATEGVAEAMHWLREDVDGVIYVLDSSQDPFTQVNTMLIGIIESRKLPVLILANKTDLENASVKQITNAFPQHETIPLSALEGDNMDEVYDKIAEYFG